MALGANDGLTVTYQGRLCLPEFSITRPTGLEPGYGFLGMDSVDLGGTFDVVPSLPGVDSPAPVSTVAKSSPNTPGATGKPLNSSGDLVIFEQLGGAIKWQTTLSGMIITEKGIETIKAVDGGTKFVRVEIADIRYLWKTRGIIFAWINMPKLASGQSTVAPGAPSVGDPMASVPATTSIGGTTDGKLFDFVAGSDDSGVPWTLRRCLEVVVLPRLPGQPALKRLPPDLDGNGAIPIGHAWDGILPVKALADLLDEFQLVISLNHDGSISLWHEGEGKVTREDGWVIHYDSGNEDEYVSNSREIATPHYIPSTVVVLGPPIRDTARMLLEPVGEIRDKDNPGKSGRIVPLDDAVKALGLATANAKTFVLMTPAERALMDLPETTVKELEKWAYRWYRVPDPVKLNADKLPVQDRGTVDDFGVFLPPRVWSESLAIIQGAAIAKKAQGGISTSASPWGKSQVNSALYAMIGSAGSNITAVQNLPFSEQSSGYEIDRVSGVVKFHEIQCAAIGINGETGFAPIYSAIVDRPAKVQLEWGFDRKPGLNQNVVISHRYASFWAKQKNGSITQQPSLDPNAIPVVVHRPDLLQVNDADGNTNKGPLDSVAKKIATAILARPAVTSGATIELHRPVPVATNGLVTTTTYTTSQSRPRVTIHVGCFSPLVPARAETHARQPNYKTLRQSILTPKEA